MARYEDLPLYKKAMEAGIYFQDTVRQFSHYNNYTIGADLRNLSRDIVSLVISANSSVDKAAVLFELVVFCEMLKNTIVFAKKAKAFQNFKKFQYAVSMADVLCRQSEGWLKRIRKNSRNYQPAFTCGSMSVLTNTVGSAHREKTGIYRQRMVFGRKSTSVGSRRDRQVAE